jgi:hypothetical protein
MPTTQPTNNFSSNELLQAAAQLNPAELEKFVAEAIALRAQRQTANLSAQESELLLKINRGIAPKTQRRFDELVAKRQNETLAPEEHRELLRLTDKIEKADAKRIELLAELARIRRKTFDEVFAELGIGLAENV